MKSRFFQTASFTALTLGLASTLWLIAPNAYADGDSNFRCERIREVSLAELKAKLVENCDLSKPFSFSQEPALKIGYTYCCTTKAQAPVKTASSE
ncbi:MAG: hypothetical protein ACJ763_15665 [Bdellovibrionia bacterium]